MKKILLLLLTVAGPILAQDEGYSTGQKSEYILAIQHRTGTRFIREGDSIDGRSVRWTFDAGKFHGIPVTVDVIAFPTPDQVDTASVAALAEAMAIYYWLQQTQKSSK